MGPSCPRKNRHSPRTKFLAHVHCGQMAGWIMMPLGTEVNLGPGDIVLDGADLRSSLPPKRGTALQSSFRFMSVVAYRLYG